MKRNSNDNTIGEVIDLVLHQYGLSGRYREFRLLQSWYNLMGPMVANRTENLSLHNKVLYVRLKSPSLRNELAFGKQKIISMLNEAAGQELIGDIIFQ